MEKHQRDNKYLLLFEFEVRTVSYGPIFFSAPIYGQVQSVRTKNTSGKTRIRNLQYGPRKRG